MSVSQSSCDRPDINNTSGRPQSVALKEKTMSEKKIDAAPLVELMRARHQQVTYTMGDEGGQGETATLASPVYTAAEWEAIAWYLLGELDGTEDAR
jgi:hypothetical protein